jgi:hypothetical protein
MGSIRLRTIALITVLNVQKSLPTKMSENSEFEVCGFTDQDVAMWHLRMLLRSRSMLHQVSSLLICIEN